MISTLAIYCGLIALASLGGGLVPLVVRLTHRRMQIALSFVAGVMLGVGLLHLLPHSFYELEQGGGPSQIAVTVFWVLVGFMLMFFLERFFHFHHHDAPDEAEVDSHEGHSHAHDHAHGHDSCEMEHHSAHRFAWGGAAIGLLVHTIVEGIALGAALRVDQQDQLIPWAGAGTFLAILLHKPFDSLTIGTLMAAGGWSPASRHLVNFLYAMVVPCTVLAFYFGADQLGESHQFLGKALGFAAGAFLCIATSDLLPELQFHHHDRLALSIALVAGIALAMGLVRLEESGHDHHSHLPARSAAPAVNRNAEAPR